MILGGGLRRLQCHRTPPECAHSVGLRRLQFGQTGRGPGVVKVDEGQIAYFGPLTGGAVA